MNKKNIFFKVDANDKIGGGHLHRCISLANILKSYRNVGVNFIFSDTPKNYVDKVTNVNIKVYFIDKNKDLDIQEYRKIIPSNSLILFDTDNSQFHSGKLIDSLADINIKTACFTVTDKYPITTDILINTNLISLYQNYITKYSTIKLLGPKYLIFNEEIRKLTDFGRHMASKNNLLVFFGNADSNNITIFFIEILKRLRHIFGTINVLVGGLNYDIDTIENCLINTNNIKVHKDLSPSEIINLYKNTDLIITSAGMTMWEAALFSIPQLIIASSERELAYTNLLSQEKLIYKLSTYKELTDSDGIYNKITSIISSKELDEVDTKKFKYYINNNGALSLCNYILEEI